MPPDVAVWETQATPGEVTPTQTVFRSPPIFRGTYTCMQAHGLYLIGDINHC